MNRKISRFNMDKSGQSYDIEPRGFSAFKADVLRRIASIQSQIDMLNGVTPSGGSGSSSGGSSSGSGSSSSGGSSSSSSSSGTTGTGGTVRNFTFKSNRKNTTVTVRYKKSDDTWVEKTATIPQINTNYVVCSESSTQIDDDNEFTYTAIFKGNDGTVLEEITGSSSINDIKSNPISLTFNEVDKSGYYLRVVGAEPTLTGFKYTLNENGGKIRVVVESNIRYSVYIAPRTEHWPYVPEDFAFFTVNGVKYTDAVRLRCSGDQTFELDIAPYVYEPDISELGQRNEDVYSITAYEYGSSSMSFVRLLYFDIQLIDQNCGDSVQAQNGHILQYSRYVKDENQEVEMRMSNDIRNGYLNGCGGSFTFQIKPKTYWYIRSEIEEGFGTPNALKFSPAEGNPSNDWIDINVSWTGDSPGLPYNTRQLLMQICSVIGDKVICEKKFDGVKDYTHKWSTLPKFLNNDPSGELQSGDKEKGKCSPKAWKNWGDSVLNSFVGIGYLPDGTSYLLNYVTVNRESKVIYIHVRSNINYKLNRDKLPDYLRDNITYIYSPNTNYYAPEGTEGKPGQHMYKLILPENTTGDDRVIDIEFTSMNPKYTGSTISHITQKGTYRDNIEPTSDNYSLIQEANRFAFKNQYDSLSLNVISKKPFVITNTSSKTSYTRYYSEYTFDNMCPATNEFREIALTDFATKLYLLTNEGKGDEVWVIGLGEPYTVKPVIG